MFASREEIEALFGVEPETESLDFKRGVVLGHVRTTEKCEFIKDVTALANAGGGVLVYGVSTKMQNGASVAAGFDLVAPGVVTHDQLTQIIHANTDPPLTGFRMHSVPIDDSGLVVVIEVGEGDTATQNRLDHRFYQRVGATTGPMAGYAVRDVMNRRRTPRLAANVCAVRSGATCRIAATLRNVGSVTARHWRFVLEIPEPWRIVQDMGATPGLRIQRPSMVYEGLEYVRWEFSSDRMPPTTAPHLMPEEGVEFSQGRGYPETWIDNPSRGAAQEIALRPPIRWVCYVDDAAPVRGEIPFEDWCTAA